LNLDSPRVMDSTAALRLEEVPSSLLVVGGGYTGLELGYVYAALGSRVTVVELTDGLLPGVDRDLVRPLQASAPPPTCSDRGRSSPRSVA
jgi:dihydrolipoamide dehydrogenase